MHTDLLDGLDWTIHQGYADPKRVCIFGGSYGGYSTLVRVAFTPDVFTCGVDLFGPANPVSLMERIPPYWGPIRALFAQRLRPLPEPASLRPRPPALLADP